MHNTARTVSRRAQNVSHSVVKHTQNFVNNHRRAIEITRNVVAIASIALIAIPLVAPVAIPAMAIAALGIVEVCLDLAVGDNTSAAVGLLCLFPMGKGFKYVTEIGGDAIKGGSKTKILYKLASKQIDNVANKLIKFRGDEAVIHFGKHGKEMMDALSKSSYNIKNYIDDANYVIKNGQYVPELNGYVKLIGGKGSAKYGFVGLNRATGNITTFHIKTASELSKKAPSLKIIK
ncbi:hypothetical protein [Clostridium botulinum]|uniref:hypothetical protein n=1 Tax=Clostridium botulinum TaxID=1491 RepID=UPI003DA46228